MAFVFETKDGSLTEGGKSVLDSLAAAMSDPNSTDQVLIHLHGGLVDGDDGQTIADRLLKEKFYGSSDRHLVFPLWTTGGVETLSSQLRKMALHKALSRALRTIFKIVQKKGRVKDTRSGGAGNYSTAELDALFERLEDIARNPDQSDDVDLKLEALEFGDVADDLDLEDEISSSLADDDDFTEAIKAIEAQAASDAGKRTVARTQPMDDFLEDIPQSFRNEIEDACSTPQTRGIGGVIFTLFSKRAWRAARGAIGRLLSGRGHGVWPTVVEEAARAFLDGDPGTFIWEGIKADSAAHFNGNGAGDALLKALDSGLAQQTEPGRTQHITLVAHSAGAIWLADMLNAWRNSNVAVPSKLDVIFLAPAIDYKSLAAAAHSMRELGVRFHMITMTDEAEAADRMVPILYPRSLLYAVSGLFERREPDDPIVGMARFLDVQVQSDLKSDERGWISSVGDFLGPQQLILGPTQPGAPEGKQSNAKKHGDFDRDEKTIASVLALSEA